MNSIEVMRRKIFPFFIEDVKLSLPNDMLLLLKFRSVNISFEDEINKAMIEYLLKHKKFMDASNVYSMAREPMVNFMNETVRDVIDKKIEGDIVEAGVWRGGMGMWINFLTQYYGNVRKMWMFDAFDVFPEPEYDKDLYVHPVSKILYENVATLDIVKKNFNDFGLLTNNLIFVKGKIEKSVPNVSIPKISILFLDCEYYDPTKIVLEKYYPSMMDGAYVIINNYFNQHVHAKKAIDEYREKHKINKTLITIGDKHVYWKV